MSDASSSTPDVPTSMIETDYTVGQDNIQTADRAPSASTSTIRSL